ncbi:MAG: HD domain-containing protein [Syntrophales bacterium]|nr:HD domain-containing protein [Syntrophales bacterium]
MSVETTIVVEKNDDNGNPWYARIAGDIPEHKQTQRCQELFNKILLELNSPDEATDSVRRICLLVKDFTGIESVRIRLKEGEGYTCDETDGVDKGFREAWDCLCAHGTEGNSSFEWMCEKIMYGRMDTAFSFFAEAGSFWSNNRTILPASNQDKDPEARTQNLCRAEGGESVAFIPLRFGEEIVGILQLNDKRPDCFTPETVKFLEAMGTSIGAILAHRKTDKLIRKSEANFLKIIEHNVNSMVIVDMEGGIRFVNPAAEALFCMPEKELLGSQFGFPLIGEERTEIDIFRPSGHGTAVAEIDRVKIEWCGRPSYLVSLHDMTARKNAEEERNIALEKLTKTLAGTINAMSLTVEARDLYTAGHQRRVSCLARAVAEEMGLQSHVVYNICTAGIVHDIGKISMPAEILSKPTTLSDIEFAMIKTHPQSGYNILKEAELPCAIAQAVLQHHERIDGSGYPKGLRGNDILLEARILAVADVVEAITSHRPYRPAKGITVAINEIEKNKGILYDTEAANACIRLFREKGFVFD